jgi:hypothetical protein
MGKSFVSNPKDGKGKHYALGQVTLLLSYTDYSEYSDAIGKNANDNNCVDSLMYYEVFLS